jgi:hypothetical protein
MQPAKLAALALIWTCGVANTAVHAAEFAAAACRTSYGRCHMDVCSFFIIDCAVPVGSTSSGTLYAISGRGWDETYKMRGENDQHEYDRPPVSISKQAPFIDMVFCSKAKPIFFGFYDGIWNAEQLRPGDHDAVFGYNESTYQFYWAACHNHTTHDPYETALARKLGYNFSGGFGDTDRNIELQPFDVLR